MGVQSRDADEKRRRDFENHHGFNHHQSELWASEQFNIFPNFNIHVALNGWWSMQYWPLAPGKAKWERRYYSSKPSNMREDLAAQYSLALNRDTVMRSEEHTSYLQS